MPQLIEMETARLRLRRWRSTDLSAFQVINADPRVTAFLAKQLSPKESDALAGEIRTRMDVNGWGLWAVEVKRGPAYIGFVGLNVPTAALPFAPCVEIAWRLAATHWGHGYASEAAGRVLEVAFKRLAMSEIVSFTAVSNWRSRRVMERIGMGYSGLFNHPELPPDSPLRTHVLYRLHQTHWLDSHRNEDTP